MELDVLLVEDDQMTARVITRLLESVGMTVSCVDTLRRALDTLTLRPTLVVLDLMLPDGSGVEVLRAVRDGNLACKVAVVSAADDPALFVEVQRLKPDAVFGKPLEFDDFVDWISTIFTEDPSSLRRTA